MELSSGGYSVPKFGMKNALHGTIYQLKLLMLFLKRGLDKGYEFSLATEMDDAEKFDDLFFVYKKTDNDEESYISLQAKHKQEKDGEYIGIGDLLLKNKDKPFMLTKYFLSFLKIREKFGENGDFFIFTNNNFDFTGENLNIRQPKSGSNKDVSLSLINTSENCILNKFLGIDKGKYYKINKNFLGVFKTFLKKYFKEEIKFIKKNKESLDVKIEKFFEKLVFSVEQPSEDELDDIFKQNFAEDKNFGLLDPYLITSAFEKEVMGWFKDKKGKWFTKEKAEQLFISIGDKINSIVSIGYGQAYYEELIDYGIEFKKSQLLEELIKSEKYVSHVKTSSILSSSIEIARALEKSSAYKNKDSYLFMRLKTLLIPSIQEKVINSFKSSEGHNLLIISDQCGGSVKEKKIKELCKELPDMQDNKKIIVISTRENYLVKTLGKKFTGKFYEKSNEINFNDLTEESQKKLLEEKIKFQGQDNEIHLNQIVSKENTELTQLLPLEYLIKGKEIEIGKSIPISSGYDPDFYIDRTFNQQVTIESKIFNDIKLNKFTDSIAKSQQEFEQLCQKKSNKNVHWLQEESGQWLWKKSQGSLSDLKKYIDTSQTKHHSNENVQTFVSDKPVPY